MSSSAALQSFVEDELKRMPALAQKVMDDTLMALSNMPMTSEAAERFKAVDLTMTLRPQRQRVAAAFVESLQEQVRRLMSGDRSALRDQASGAGPGAGPRGLQLMDEGKVASEVLIAKCIDQIKGAAEFEFRELTAFVCALVGTCRSALTTTLSGRMWWPTRCGSGPSVCPRTAVCGPCS
jgi:hypothetical protein